MPLHACIKSSIERRSEVGRLKSIRRFNNTKLLYDSTELINHRMAARCRSRSTVVLPSTFWISRLIRIVGLFEKALGNECWKTPFKPPLRNSNSRLRQSKTSYVTKDLLKDCNLIKQHGSSPSSA